MKSQVEFEVDQEGEDPRDNWLDEFTLCDNTNFTPEAEVKATGKDSKEVISNFHSAKNKMYNSVGELVITFKCPERKDGRPRIIKKVVSYGTGFIHSQVKKSN